MSNWPLICFCGVTFNLKNNSSVKNNFNLNLYLVLSRGGKRIEYLVGSSSQSSALGLLELVFGDKPIEVIFAYSACQVHESLVTSPQAVKNVNKKVKNYKFKKLNELEFG